MDEQSRWMVRLLEASLQSSGLTEREVEERLGWERGALGRILNGAAHCPPQQLLTLLAELSSEKRGNLSPPQRRERGTQMVQELIERFRRLGYGQPGATPVMALPLPTVDEIERTVEDILQRTFGELGKGRRGG